MLYRIALLLEIISIVVCIFRIYNRQIRIDVKTIGLCLSFLIVLEAVNYFALSNAFTLITYLFLILYCVLEFHDTIVSSVVSVLLLFITITILQFLAVIPFSILLPDKEELRMLATNFIVAFFTLWALPAVKISAIRRVLRKKEILVFAIFCAALVIMTYVLIESKVGGKIELEPLILAVPLLAILFVGLYKWNAEREDKENVQAELWMREKMQEDYDDLLTTIRTRQHGFKNHIEAILAMKYTDSDYDDLVKEQRDYYEGIREENRFQRLLYLGDSVIAGYLYKRFREMDGLGIEVSYELTGCFGKSKMPVHHLVEILGTLMDNAVEAQRDAGGIRHVHFVFQEDKTSYIFKIANPYPWVSSTEMTSWFQLGTTTKKGENRGVGLFRVHELASQNKADIICRNIEREQKNWIEISIKTQKADRQ